MKSYTDLEQSKKLTEILPIESADMYYTPFPLDGDGYYDTPQVGAFSKNEESIYLPCWSLAALLDNIPQVKLDSIIQYNEKLWRCLSYFKSEWNESIWCNNPVDACYEMILKLHEQKLL